MVDGKKEQPESPVLELDAGWDDWGDEPAKGSEPVVNERPTLAPTFDLEALAREKSSLGLPEKGAPPSGAPLPPPPPMPANNPRHTSGCGTTGNGSPKANSPSESRHLLSAAGAVGGPA